MSYQFHSDGPMDTEAFTAAAFRQPQAAFLKRAYWPLHGWTLLVMVFIIFGCAAISDFLIATYSISGTAALLAGLLPFGLAFVAWIGFNRSLIKTMYRRMLDSPLYNGPINYEVSEQGFTMRSDTALWTVHWPAMDKVTRHPKGIFLYAGGFIYLIPNKVPPLDIYDTLWADIKTWFEDAQP